MALRQPSPVDPPRSSPSGLGYFVVRVRRMPGTALGEVTGIVERLGTGEKRPFLNSMELTRIIEEWSV